MGTCFKKRRVGYRLPSLANVSPALSFFLPSLMFFLQRGCHAGRVANCPENVNYKVAKSNYAWGEKTGKFVVGPVIGWGALMTDIGYQASVSERVFDSGFAARVWIFVRLFSLYYRYSYENDRIQTHEGGIIFHYWIGQPYGFV